MTSSHPTSTIPSSFFIAGALILFSTLTCLNVSRRPRSHIQYSLTAGLNRGVWRRISLFLTHEYMLQPRAHPGQIVSVDDISHTLALNRKSRLVSAPTGQMSMVFIA